MNSGKTIFITAGASGGHLFPALAVADELRARGYRCVFVLPDKVGEDKRNVLLAYGAEIVVTPTAVAPESPESYYSVSDRLARRRLAEG